MVDAFDQLPLASRGAKARVGLVGEILVKFHPDANNHAVDVIESEGCEAVMPGLLDFFLYCFYNSRLETPKRWEPAAKRRCVQARPCD